MDALDHKLIALLRRNARATVAELAHRLKVSRGTVTNRMNKLECAGIVTGYTVQLQPKVSIEEVVAWMNILVDGNHSRAVLEALLGEPSISAVHGTNGRWDLLAELRTSNLPELSKALERIRLIRGIRNTETSIHLSSHR